MFFTARRGSIVRLDSRPSAPATPSQPVSRLVWDHRLYWNLRFGSPQPPGAAPLGMESTRLAHCWPIDKSIFDNTLSLFQIPQPAWPVQVACPHNNSGYDNELCSWCSTRGWGPGSLDPQKPKRVALAAPSFFKEAFHPRPPRTGRAYKTGPGPT